jgi:hypothetical protein
VCLDKLSGGDGLPFLLPSKRGSESTAKGTTTDCSNSPDGRLKSYRSFIWIKTAVFWREDFGADPPEEADRYWQIFPPAQAENVMPTRRTPY